MYLRSDASNTSTRSLVHIHNDHADSTGTTALEVRNDSTGKAIYANGGGIVEKDGVLKENLLTNSGFDVWSNSTLEDVGSEEVTNGDFSSDVSGWSLEACTAASVAGGQSGNCLEITRVSAGLQQAYQALSGLTVGKIYRFTAYVKSGTSGNEAGFLFVNGNGSIPNSRVDFTTTSSWVQHTIVFEAGDDTPFVHLEKETSTAGTMLFDTASVKEVTPGCVAADALAMDGWKKATATDLFREHTGSNTQTGSFYSVKTVTASTAQWFYPKPQTDSVWLGKVRGRTMTMGFWAKTSTASHVRLGWYDDGYTYSSYHTGGGGWEWLELSEAVDADAEVVSPVIRLEATGATCLLYTSPSPRD